MLQVHCDQLSSEVDVRSRRLANIESGIQSHVLREKRLARLEDERSVKQYELAKRDARYTELVDVAASRSAALSEVRARAGEASKVLRLIRKHYELSQQATSLESQLERARRDLAAVAERRESLAKAVRERRERLEEVVRRVQQARSGVEEHQKKRQALEDIARRLSSQAERESEIKAARQRLESSRADLQELEEAINGERARESSLQVAVADGTQALSLLQSDSAEREELLSRLRSMTEGDRCPLCGTRHESEGSLIEAIESVLSRVPKTTRTLAEGLQSERTKLAEVSGALDAHEKRRVVTLRVSDALRATLEAHDAESGAIEALARNLNLPASESNVLSELTAVREGEAASRTALLAATTEEKGDQQRIEVLERDLDGCIEQMTARELSLRRLEKSDADLRHRLEEFGELLDIQPHEKSLDAEVDRLAAADAELQRSVDAEASDHRQAEEQVQTASRQRAELARVVKSLDDEIGVLGTDIQGFRSKLREAGLESDVSVEILLERRAELDAYAAAVARARELAEKAELQASLDAVLADCRRQEAELREVERKISDMAAQIRTVMQAQAVVRSWAQPLESGLDAALEKTIGAHQEAIERHFKAMIPAPHLFEGIGLRRMGSQLQLGVRYRGQATDSGEPRMFLSNAQLNLLALAIFLSMGARQRWARLQSLLLDDPIQHLDDLDAVAFLDTLRAVALGRLGERRQIIMSTCDRNLFRLMVQKFEPLRSVGTTFSAVTLVERGSEGPEIRPYRPKALESPARTK